MSDRVLVMAQGRIAGELTAAEATQDSVMALAVSTESGTNIGTNNVNNISNNMNTNKGTTAVEGSRGH
jgi:ribose transport system ATP-binding protein